MGFVMLQSPYCDKFGGEPRIEWSNFIISDGSLHLFSLALMSWMPISIGDDDFDGVWVVVLAVRDGAVKLSRGGIESLRGYLR